MGNVTSPDSLHLVYLLKVFDNQNSKGVSFAARYVLHSELVCKAHAALDVLLKHYAVMC